MHATQDTRIELRRQAIQSAIDAGKSSQERNRLGQFATPNALAIAIAEYLDTLIEDRSRMLRFADPSLGTGSFFSAALNVFGRNRIANAVGIEVDSEFCQAASDLWTEAGLTVVCGDFTHLVASASCPSAPNLILANPPYVRHHHLDPDAKAHLKRLTESMTGVEVSGLAGLYVYFLLLATAWMEEDGYAAWLIPSEFMDVNYGIALKRFLTNRVTFVRAHRFDPADVQFGDALVSSVVIVVRKTPPPPDHTVEFTFAGTLAEPQVCERIPLEVLRESRKWTSHPSHAKTDRSISDGVEGPTLADFFRVQRGIATGNNKFFVLDRSEAMRRGLPNRYLKPILPSPRHLRERIIETDNDGYPLIDEQLCVIDCDLPEHIVEDRHPSLWEYLQTADKLGIKDGYLIGKRRPWYKQEQREPAQFLCTYMGRGADEKRPFRFILNRSQAIGTNLYLMLYPQKGLARMLHNHPDRIVGVYDFLNSVTGNELRGEGRVYGGGLHKIEPSELSRVSALALVARWPELQESLASTQTPCLFPM
jgi:adenine-specific DNA-methyltransferase